MKRCDYCGKEITYHQQYCDEKCERLAKKYYRTARNMRTIFSIVNIAGLIGLILGLFWAVLSSAQTGAFIAGAAALILGFLYFLLPFGTEEQIKKNKIEKTVKRIKLLGIFGFILGIIIIVCGFLIF